MQIFILFLMFVSLMVYISLIQVRRINIEGKNGKNFESNFSKALYLVSYCYPIKSFARNDRKLNKKEKKIKKDIEELGLSYLFNFEMFMALRYFLLFLSFAIFLFIFFTFKLYNNISSLFPFVLLLLLPLIPNLYLKKKRKEYKRFCYDEAIILQLLIILLVESSSTIENVILALSKLETYHKKTFQKAYRICSRSKSESLSFLEDELGASSLGNSFNVLNNMHKYSKEDTVRILESNFKEMERINLKESRRKELVKFSYSQVSVVAPFLSVILLGAVPFINYGINSILIALEGF